MIFSIFWNLRESQIGALYKFCHSKFVLVFASKAVKEKLQSTEIQCRFGDSEICLSLRKRICPLRNGREPIFVNILLHEFISDQAVRLTVSNFGEVVSVLKGRHKFNRSIRNGKRHVRIFPTGVDPAIWPRKIYFHGNIQRDVLFTKKVVLCARGAKLVTCLARIVLLSHLLKKIPACLSLSGVLLLHGIQALDSLIILQRLFLALKLCNNLLFRRRM